MAVNLTGPSGLLLVLYIVSYVDDARQPRMKGAGPSSSIPVHAMPCHEDFQGPFSDAQPTVSHEALDIRFQPFHCNGFPFPSEFHAPGGRRNGAAQNSNPTAWMRIVCSHTTP